MESMPLHMFVSHHTQHPLCCRLTQDLIEQQGVPFQQGIHYLKSFLPASAVLIGQNIGQDVRWLQLKEGRDFQVVLHC